MSDIRGYDVTFFQLIHLALGSSAIVTNTLFFIVRCLIFVHSLLFVSSTLNFVREYILSVSVEKDIER